MARTSSVLFLVAGIIAFLGDVALMYLLFQTGNYFGAFASANPSEIPNAGVPTQDLQSAAKQLLFLVNIGWIWALAVLVVSLGMVYYSASDILGKKKK